MCSPSNAAEERTGAAADRPALGLRGGGALVLPAARALGARRGRPVARPAGARRRSAAPPSARRRRSPGLERPLGRYLLELQPEHAEGRSWYGEPGAGELRDWQDVLDRAGVSVSPVRVAQAYLELAVLVRALEGLRAAADIGSEPDRSSLWAGLFDLRENLLGRTLEDLRAIAA